MFIPTFFTAVFLFKGNRGPRGQIGLTGLDGDKVNISVFDRR